LTMVLSMVYGRFLSIIIITAPITIIKTNRAAIAG